MLCLDILVEAFVPLAWHHAADVTLESPRGHNMNKSIFLCMASVLTACGKTSLEEKCESACEKATPYVSECAADNGWTADQLGDDAVHLLEFDSCLEECSRRIETATETDCLEEYEVLVDCLDDTNYAVMTCGDFADFCATELASSNSCMASGTNGTTIEEAERYQP